MTKYIGNAYIPNGEAIDGCGGYACATDGGGGVGCGAAGCVAAACGIDLCFANACFACLVDIIPWESTE